MMKFFDFLREDDEEERDPFYAIRKPDPLLILNKLGKESRAIKKPFERYMKLIHWDRSNVEILDDDEWKYLNMHPRNGEFIDQLIDSIDSVKRSARGRKIWWIVIDRSDQLDVAFFFGSESKIAHKLAVATASINKKKKSYEFNDSISKDEIEKYGKMFGGEKRGFGSTWFVRDDGLVLDFTGPDIAGHSAYCDINIVSLKSKPSDCYRYVIRPFKNKRELETYLKTGQ